MMGEPTRGALRVPRTGMSAVTREVTDEELEPIHRAWLRGKVNPTCPECGGRGWQLGFGAPGRPCPRCDGRGHLGVDLDELREALTVLMDGDWMRMQSDGNAHLFPPAIVKVTLATRALLDLLGEEES